MGGMPTASLAGMAMEAGRRKGDNERAQRQQDQQMQMLKLALQRKAQMEAAQERAVVRQQQVMLAKQQREHAIKMLQAQGAQKMQEQSRKAQMEAQKLNDAWEEVRSSDKFTDEEKARFGIEIMRKRAGLNALPAAAYKSKPEPMPSLDESISAHTKVMPDGTVYIRNPKTGEIKIDRSAIKAQQSAAKDSAKKAEKAEKAVNDEAKKQAEVAAKKKEDQVKRVRDRAMAIRAEAPDITAPEAVKRAVEEIKAEDAAIEAALSGQGAAQPAADEGSGWGDWTGYGRTLPAPQQPAPAAPEPSKAPPVKINKAAVEAVLAPYREAASMRKKNPGAKFYTVDDLKNDPKWLALSTWDQDAALEEAKRLLEPTDALLTKKIKSKWGL